MPYNAGVYYIGATDSEFGQYANTTWTTLPPTVSISPTCGPAGSVVTATGSNFAVNSATNTNGIVYVVFDNNFSPPITLIRPDTSGNFTEAFAIPTSGAGGAPIVSGSHTIAFDNSEGAEISMAFNVPGCTQIGTVTELTGTVSDGGVTLSPGSPVYLSDTINTGSNGRVLITFSDNTQWLLGAGTTAVLNEYVYNPSGAPANGNFFLQALTGAFAYTSGLIAPNANPPPDNKVIEEICPAGVCGSLGIRGTQFISWPGTVPNSVELDVIAGTVAITPSQSHTTTAFTGPQTIVFGASGITSTASLTQAQYNALQNALFASASAAPAIGLTKSANITRYAASGTLVTYDYQVTNTGNVTLNPVTITDPMAGLSAVSCPGGSLIAAASEICTATYTTTQADVDTGSMSNTATANGTPPSGPAVNASATLTIPAVQMPGIGIELSALPTIFPAPGAVVTYRYLVTNSGNVDLSAISVNDTMSGLSTITCTGATLAPGASQTCSAIYITTQADVDAGSISNSATASGKLPIGSVVTSAKSTVAIPASDAPAIAVVKSASIASYPAAGTPVTYSYKVTNTGNETLKAVTVADPMAGLSTVSCPVTLLAPAASETCTATYTTTTSDVTRASITNTGTATGTPEIGANAIATSTLTIPYEAFTISDAPAAVSLVQGSSGTSTIATTVSGAFNSAIGLSASGQPAGVTVGFNPTSIAAPGSGTATMSLAVTSTAATGTYPITVTGTGGGLTHTTTVSLTVTAPATLSFSISDAPAAVSVVQGSTGTSTIAATVSGGFSSAIALGASGQPPGVTVGFNPTSIAAPGSGTATMTLAVASTAASGTYPITVTGTGGGLTHTTIVNLTVTAPQPHVSVTPAALAFGTVGQYGLVLKTVTVKNTGAGAVSIANAAVKPGSGQTNEFYALTLCPSSLAAGKSCTIIVGFLASATGPAMSTLSIADNAEGGPQLVGLTATVIKRFQH
jgi:uncharacterized repeat protein (TIGR01451 family)